MVNNFLKNNLAILFGNVFFRIGGYICKFLMVYLLDNISYGILTVVSPFQNTLQILAAGGLPPTISKYISEYNATNNEEESYKIILVSFKISIVLGILFGLIMVFFVAPFLVKIYKNPILLVPLQCIGLIVPFSAVVGVFRGIFQGVYKMQYILLSRGVEQIIMILSSILLIIIGFSVVGALLGTVIGFFCSLISVIIILHRYFFEIYQGVFKLKLDFKEELKIAYKIISFSIPVILTAISEIGVYSVTTTIMPLFITISEIGYFGIAEPIARLPLMISNSLATTMLPVSSEMLATKNNDVLKKYIFNAFRYNLIVMVPICLFLIIFSKEVLLVMFFTKPNYSKGATVLSILTIGMFFYSIFTISSSMIQGSGKPKISMYLLIGAFIQILLLSFILIPFFGVNGGAIATALTTLTISLISLFYLNKLVSINFNISYYIKILFSGLITGVFLLILPSNFLGFCLGLICLFPSYILVLMLAKGFMVVDLEILLKFENKVPIKILFEFFKKIIIKGIK
ncbi:stage V sporulation protein B [Methanobrevibacter gottschalkii]|uniref:Stage V sporulation protein B n=1 Tax=Methanobrevibacter gottschalkii TaxID=190974 RepID=A0A1H7FE26_9EURY|nr:flippase [Methanobrevibacter gottschalkii]SEK23994.1 stage V sporulation protein B [Methanobrevibacter gottschalkii]